jgi:hypothetical protein
MQILFISTFSLLSSCVNPYSPVERVSSLTSYETTFYPDVGLQSRVNLGDTMMVQGKGWYVDCIVPDFGYTERSRRSFVLTVKKGEKMCGEKEGDNYFTTSYDALGRNIPLDVVISDRANRWSVTNVGNNMAQWCAVAIVAYCHKRSITDHKIVKEFRQAKDTFQQSIEYMGRSGDVLKFIYVEFNENMARAAFNRNFQVDLKEGKIVNYKGAEIEIIEADNVQVTYVIKKYFGGAR